MPGLALSWGEGGPGTEGSQDRALCGVPSALPWQNQVIGSRPQARPPGGTRGSAWPRRWRLPGGALATGAFRLWKYHLPAGIIQPNYRDNHRCGGEARKNARVFRVVPYLFRRRKRFRGSFPQQGKGSGPKMRRPGSARCRCRLSGGALPAPHPQHPSSWSRRTASLGRVRQERLLLVHPARKMEREEDGTGHPARPLARYYMSQLI